VTAFVHEQAPNRADDARARLATPTEGVYPVADPATARRLGV
jgi:hypothetical protein